MTFGIDMAWGRPGVTAIRNLGASFICRYVSHDTTGKNLDPTEAQTYSNAGLNMVLVWEQGATDMRLGANQGAADAHDAAGLAHSVGMPGDRPLYFAADWDVQNSELNAVLAYMHGAAQILDAKRVGVYGGYRVVKAVLDAGYPWAWQTYAWSGGQWDPRAQIQQYSNDHFLNGVGIDYDRATKADYGQWRIGWTPNPNPNPSPNPVPTGEDEMPMGVLLQTHSGNGVMATPLAFKPGQYKVLRLKADNGYQSHPPVILRLAFYLKANDWQVIQEIHVDSAGAPTTIPVPVESDGASIVYKDDGAIPVAWSLEN